jgi:hypothetical protein
MGSGAVRVRFDGAIAGSAVSSRLAGALRETDKKTAAFAAV